MRAQAVQNQERTHVYTVASRRETCCCYDVFSFKELLIMCLTVECG